MVVLKKWILTGTTSATMVLLLWNIMSIRSIPYSIPPWPAQRNNNQRFLEARLAHARDLWEKDVKTRDSMFAEVGDDRDFPDAYIYPYNIWDFARPSFTCPHHLERIGKFGDGGKYVCGMTCYERQVPGPAANKSDPELIVYSFGVNDDSSFEAALLERTNARIWGYDNSVDDWAGEVRDGNMTDFATFRRLALDKSTLLEKDPPRSTVQDLMKANGHDYIDIVKMDIEGAEFDVLSSWIDSIRMEADDGMAPTLPIGQLLIEIHLNSPQNPCPKSLLEWTSWWSTLEAAGLRPVNNEYNLIGASMVGKPHFMEYTMISVRNEKRNKLLKP